MDRIRLVGGALALAVVGGMASLFVIEYFYGYFEPDQEIVYFQSWDSDRSPEDAAIVQQEERRMRQDAEAMAMELAEEALRGDASFPPAD